MKSKKTYTYTLWRDGEGFTPATEQEMMSVFGREELREMQRIAEDPTRPDAFVWGDLHGNVQSCNIHFKRY